MKHMMIAAMLLAGGAAHAQDVEWTQTVDVPKGANLPSGVTVDILGIAPGDTYEEAKEKLAAIIAGMGAGASSNGIREYRYEIFLPRPNGQRVTVSYVGRMTLDIDRPGTEGWNKSEGIHVSLSAPSSGHQVVAIERFLGYNHQADQPRISDVVRGLEAKLGTLHDSGSSGSGVAYQFRFDDGRAVPMGEPYAWVGCVPIMATANTSEADLPRLNPKGDCDVVFKASFNYGLSDDHAKSMWFTLGDNERARVNFTADYQFFRDYVDALQNSAGAEAPKL